MSTRPRRALIAGVLLTVLAGSVVGCGTSSDDGEAVGQEGPATTGDLTWSAVDVSGFADASLSIGQVVSGDALPVVAVGDDEHRSVAWSIDADGGKVTQLPAFPGDPWLSEAYVVASSEFVVVSARPCTLAPNADDMGPVCTPDDTVVPTVYSHRVGSGEWTVTELRNIENPPVIDNIVESTADLSIVGTHDDGVTAATIDLEAGGVQVGPAGQAAAIGCSVRSIPAVTFDAADAPKTASLPAQGDEPARSVELGGTTLVAALAPNLQCMSSRSYVLVAGEVDPSSIDSESPGDLGAEPIVPEETHETEAPTARPATHEIYDLTEPGSAPLKTGNAFLNRIIAGTSYVAQVEMTSVRVMTPDGEDIAVRELLSDAGSDYAFEGTDKGLFHFSLDSAGLVKGLDVALVS